MAITSAWAFAAVTCAQCDLTKWPTDPFAELAKLEVSEPVPNGHVVTVVDETDRPVAGADVYVVSVSAVDEDTWSFLGRHYDLMPFGFGVNALAIVESRFGARYRTAEDGAVAVDIPEDGRCLAVRGLAHAMSTRGDGSTGVSLEEYRVVRIEVVNSEGMPLPHVPVALTGPHEMIPLAAGATGPDGRAVVHAKAKYLAASGAQLYAQAALVSERRARVTLPDGYFDSERPRLLRVPLPAIGSVLVRVADADAQVFSLRAAERGAAFAGQNYRLWWPVRQDEHSALFPFVEVGAEVDASVRIQGSRKPLEARGAGPGAAGVTARLELTVDEQAFVLTGRLLDEAGEPIVNKKMWLWAGTAGNREWDEPVTDETGRFRVGLDPAEFKGDELRLEFRYSARDPRKRLPAAVRLLPTKRRGIIDVGDLRLEQEPLILAGRVVDTEGNPVEGVQIESALTMNAHIGGFSGHRALSDAEGRFTFHEAEAVPAELLLRVQSDGWRLREPLKIIAGSKDVVVRVCSIGSLSVTFADRGLARCLDIQAVRHGTEEPARVSNWRSRATSLTGLPPGRIDIILRLAGQEVTRIRDVEVKAGATPPEPRLTNIDLSSLVKVVMVRMTDVAGTPIQGLLWVRGKGSPPQLAHAMADGAGRARMPYLAGQTVFVEHQGYRQAAVEPSDESVEVTLVPRARLRLKLPEGLSLPSSVMVRCENSYRTSVSAGEHTVWRPGEEMILRPADAVEATLSLWTGPIGRECLLRQTVDLPPDTTLTDVVLAIDEDLAERAAWVDEGIRARARHRR